MLAVVFMGLFAAVFIMVSLPKNKMAAFVCDFAGEPNRFAQICSDSSFAIPTVTPGQLIAFTIDSACVDKEGLKIAITFHGSLTSEAHIQIFSTGPGFFLQKKV
jgi:hypothetical protein